MASIKFSLGYSAAQCERAEYSTSTVTVADLSLIVAPQLWASDSRAQARLTLKVDPGPAMSRSPPSPSRPHTWLDDRHGMRRDVRPPSHFCSFIFLKQIRRSNCIPISAPLSECRDALRDGVWPLTGWPQGVGILYGSLGSRSLEDGACYVCLPPHRSHPPTPSTHFLYCTQVCGRLVPMYPYHITPLLR